MADQNNSTVSNTTNTLTGGMYKDNIDLFKKENSYTSGRNATVVLSDGQRGAISAEPANKFCVSFPYTPIGFIYLADDMWAVFMTDDIDSEIGIFYDNQCKYESLTKGSQKCLNFNRTNLVTGASRRGFDCGFNIYWSDGARNPDRFLNTAKVPWVQDCSGTPVGSPCLICVDTNVLDCDKLRIAPLYSIPCLTLTKGQGGGTLFSGSYQVAVAYTINEIRVTDYVALSNIQSIFDHSGSAGAVRLEIEGAEQDTFDEMEVVIVSMINNQVQAKKLGIYSTRQSVIYIDDVDQTLPTVDIGLLPIANQAIEKSDAIYAINNYLTRVGPYTQPDFNYQPLANQIHVNYAVVEYEGDYYHKGGSSTRDIATGTVITYPMNVGYMRDEVYALFIQWYDTTGTYSAAYPIPGVSASTPATFSPTGPFVPGSLGTIASGRMAGYESEERYPDNQFEVWGSLCGQRIRHHRFPSQTEFGSGAGLDRLCHYSQPIPLPGGATTNRIRVMAIYLDNIQPPVLDPNTPSSPLITNIAGYRILRASREGHMSILAKGQVNSMRGFPDPYSGSIGYYQNYPYNDLTPDYYLTSNYNTVRVGQPNTASNPSSDNTTDPLTIVRNDLLSFHSPDTVFNSPFLGLGQLKVEMLMSGQATGYFRQAYRHGNFKTITDLNGYISAFLGALDFLITAFQVIQTTFGGNPPNLTVTATEDVPMTVPIQFANDYSVLVAGTDASVGTKILAAAVNLAVYLLWAPIRFMVLQHQILTILKSFAPPRAFAWQWDSHGEYNAFIDLSAGPYNINDYTYVKGNVQSLGSDVINNLWRNNFVALKISGNLPTLIGDTTRQTMFQRGIRPQDNDSVMGPYTDPLRSFYASYKVPQLTQYGQIGSTKNVPISCAIPVDIFSPQPYTTPVLFGGDTYINRYTEKNPFYFFNDWLQEAPDDYEYNYRNYINIPYPRYWMDNTTAYVDFVALPSRYRHLDAQVNAGNIALGILPPISTYVKNGAFYLFCNGVRDFYVESTVNVGYRDWEDEFSKRFYDPYGFTDISLIFRSDIIKSDIFYKYDYSLSAGKVWNQYISWAQTLRRDYDPLLAYTCFAYYPRRIVYSMAQDIENKRDNWRMYLPNNYKDFSSKVTAIQSINRTGALILFDDQSPVQMVGVETMPSSSGTDFTVGTGSLFNQALQSVSNSQAGIQYGSCQNRLSVINTSYGVFWVSRDAGKIFQYTGQGLKDLTLAGINSWSAKYLPSQILKIAPDYPYPDNPVIGIGVQTVYDSINEIIYFCKKDYQPKKNLVNYSNGQWWAGPCPPGTRQSGYDPVTGSPLCVFCLTTPCVGVPVTFGDPLYFDDAGWTASYDLRTNQWISYHDWRPSLSISSNYHFLTTSGKTIWRHNTAVDDYCRFYSIQHPFEIEIPVVTGVTETTLQSVEYLLDSYRYMPNGIDKAQLFGNTFSHGIVYNPEQNSGLLTFVQSPWNNPWGELQYPIFTASGTTILFNKVEDRWRFNMFNDFSRDRGQFGISIIPMFITDETGYRFTINPGYMDFSKPPLMQKRIRYMSTRIWLCKNIVGSNSLSLRYLSTKNQFSPR